MPLLQVKFTVTLPLAELLALDATEELVATDELFELLVAATLLELAATAVAVMAWLVALKQML